jgi:UDP-N-acetylglucosamine 2-epimerase (non-hydrolysing)
MDPIVEIACIVGARPNFIKIASLIRAMKQQPYMRHFLIHTGQHSSPEMSDSFFRDLELPFPDAFLGISGGTSTVQTARIMQALEPILEERRPALLVLVGDVNSTAAGALVAAKSGIRMAHVEAGLRSFDRTMPEEVNRLVTDALADYLFTTEASANENLTREGVPADRVFFCGNVMIDTLLRFKERAAESRILEQLQIDEGKYVVATLHRPSNVDDPRQLARLIDLLEKLAESLPVVFPVHPRTRKKIQEAGTAAGRVKLTSPLGYLDFLRVMSSARLVLTDSGGIQEETTVLGVPCVTVRDNTERPVTITHGTNRLAGTDPARVLLAAREILVEPLRAPAAPPPLWDGKAAARIVDTLGRLLHGRPE